MPACEHGSPLRQEDVVDRPVEAAGAAQPGDVPAARHDLGLGAREHAAPIKRAARVAARLVAVHHLEAAEHPAALLAAAAKAPPPGDAVAALDRHRLAAARHRGAGHDRLMARRIDLVHAFVRQAQGDELADAVVGDVPADRTGALGQELGNPGISDRVHLQPAERARQHHAIETGGAQLRRPAASESAGRARSREDIGAAPAAASAPPARPVAPRYRLEGVRARARSCPFTPPAAAPASRPTVSRPNSAVPSGQDRRFAGAEQRQRSQGTFADDRIPAVRVGFAVVMIRSQADAAFEARCR